MDNRIVTIKFPLEKYKIIQYEGAIIMEIEIKSKKLFTNVFFVFLFYAVVYGFLSIYTQNMIIRSLKDVLIVLFILYVFIDFYKTKDRILQTKKMFISLFLLICIIIGLLSLMSDNTVINIIYGIKITFIPILSIYIGMFIKKYNINLFRPILLIFIVVIVGWIIENKMGINALINVGFIYGVNVKNFGNSLRLPSIVGTPDGYAFVLSITGIYLSYKLKNNKIFSLLIKICTIIFLILATIRSALVFWIAFYIFSFIRKTNLIKTKKRFLYSSIAFLFLALIPLLFFFIQRSSLSATYSLQDRLSHWFVNLSPLLSSEGIIGHGIGYVGAASKRVVSIGFQSSNYAVDNQFFALYEQIGIIGCLFMIILFIIILIYIKNNKKDSTFGISLLLSFFVSSVFTNTLEMYPFNIFLFIMLGYCMIDDKKYVEVLGNNSCKHIYRKD